MDQPATDESELYPPTPHADGIYPAPVAVSHSAAVVLPTGFSFSSTPAPSALRSTCPVTAPVPVFSAAGGGVPLSVGGAKRRTTVSTTGAHASGSQSHTRPVSAAIHVPAAPLRRANAAQPTAVEDSDDELLDAVKIDRKWLMNAAKWTIIIVMLAVAGVGLTVLLQKLEQPKAPLVQPVVFAKATKHTSTPCTPVSADEIRAGKALNGHIDLNDIRASLMRHIRDGVNGVPLRGMCAQFLSVNKICHCIIDMSVGNSTQPDYQEMFNVEIIGVSPEDHVQNTEHSVLCTDPIEVRRFAEITIQYLNQNGKRHMLRVNDTAAQTVQQMNVVERGRGSCEDTAEQVQLRVLLDMMNEINSRMFHGTSSQMDHMIPNSANSHPWRNARIAARNTQQKLNELGDGNE